MDDKVEKIMCNLFHSLEGFHWNKVMFFFIDGIMCKWEWCIKIQATVIIMYWSETENVGTLKFQI